MKMRWAAALLLLTGLCANRAWADGFGFTIADATVINVKAAGNTDPLKAEVGDTFTITGAPFASYRSSGAAPAINDNDLNRYSANFSGTATEVSGTKVRYVGTFSLVYTGPAYPAGITIVNGKFDVRAAYAPDASATLNGLLLADPQLPLPAPWDKTDFSLYNSGRFFGQYAPKAGDPTRGTMSASANAGNVGFATSFDAAPIKNQKAAGNTDPIHAQVGDTFTMDAPLASYFELGGPPLNNNDLNRYSLVLNGTVTDVTGTLVTYNGTFTLKYTAPDFASGLVIETGKFTIQAKYNDPLTASAKLTGQLVAKPGMETTIVPWENSDYAIFNPGQFTGTYTPTPGDPTTGTVSGSLIGGVVGFSCSVGEGNVVNGDENHNGYADVGETFHAVGPLSAYLAVGAPPLLERDLSRYSISLDGEVKSVVGTTVLYTGTFRITFAAGTGSASIESGTFDLIAVYDQTTLGAKLSGVLTAKPGADTPVPPFNMTDYAPFNPGVFTGAYVRIGNGSSGTFRGGLDGGTLVSPIQSRKVGGVIEGSPTAATQTDDARRAIVVSGTTLWVLDPATGDEAPGWAGGKTLDGKVFARAAVLRDDLFVGTDAGTLYRFDLKTGALLNSGKPAGGGRILTAPAPDAATGAVFVIVSNIGATNEVRLFKLPATDFTSAAPNVLLGSGVISTSSPSVPYGLVFVGTNGGLFTFRAADLTPQTNYPVSTPTSPLAVNAGVYVGTGTGTTFTKLNSVTGVAEASNELVSPLMLGAFYEKKTDLVQAGLADGHIASFTNTGAFSGYTLPGLFNPENTGGSNSMPVESNNVIYRATNNVEILSGKPINGDDQQMIAVNSKVQAAMAATGQIPGADYLLATSNESGVIHMIGIR